MAIGSLPCPLGNGAAKAYTEVALIRSHESSRVRIESSSQRATTKDTVGFTVLLFRVGVAWIGLIPGGCPLQQTRRALHVGYLNGDLPFQLRRKTCSDGAAIGFGFEPGDGSDMVGRVGCSGREVPGPRVLLDGHWSAIDLECPNFDLEAGSLVEELGCHR
jgi:hypothetical protein